ncbi:XIAP-associated factor 1 [Antechinus flavipes]|uniref:XIAP-associated factor 1 n=1 Tax=Antechinus flavipes TaxID=38775 RepID=UPI002235E5F7|nr:XIAP-associated factor 1 [Antechinus flavipes]
MEEDLRLCTNCERKVPSTYFLLHEAHCLRFRAICPECKEVILKKEMKDHLENGHLQAQCSLCLESMQKYLLEAHEAACPERPIECEFCGWAVPLSGLEEHESGCSGQSGPSLSGQSGPSLSGKQPDPSAPLASLEGPCADKPRKAPSQKAGCLECKRDASEAELPQHQAECRQFTELRGSFNAFLLKKPERPSPVPGILDPAQASTGERVVRPKKKESHTDKTALSSTAARIEKEEYDVLESCSFCHILLPLPVLKQHEEKCQLLASQQWKILK